MQPICTEKVSLVVKNKPAEAALQELYEIHKDKTAVKAIDVPGCIREGVAARDVLIARARNVDSWSMPCDLQCRRSELQELMDDFDSKLATMVDYFNSLLKAKGEDKSIREVKRRKVRYGLDKTKQKLTKGCCPQALKTLVVDAVVEHGYEESRNLGPPVAEVSGDAEEFTLVKTINVMMAGIETPTVWHTLFTTLQEKYASLAIPTCESMVAQVSAQNATHGTMALQGAEPAELNPSSDLQPFVKTVPLPPLVSVMKAWSYDMSIQASPLKGIRVCVTILSGAFHVTFLPCGLVPDGLNVDLFFDKTSAASTLKKCQSCIIIKGGTLAIPFGTIPIFISLADDPTKEEQEPFGSLISYHIMEQTKDAKEPEELRAEVSSSLRKAMGAKLPHLLAFKKTLLEWQTAIDQVS